MRDFNAAACPDPGDVEAERGDVIRHYTNFVMERYDVGTASVQVRFSGSCFAGRRGDACIAVPVFWDSTDKRTTVRSSTSGIDHLTGVYAATASRWWLCSSNFEPTGTAGHAFYSSRR
jgi:hypothetical protein